MAQPKTQEEIEDALKHRDVILHIRAILATKSGIEFFKYLFEVFGVTELPEIGLEGQLLFEKMGFLRAGKSIFKLVSEADFNVAAQLIAKTEKEKADEIYKEFQDGQG